MPAKKNNRIKETFKLEAPSAGAVLLAGDFTGWETEPIKMKRDRTGLWTTTVPLDPGAYHYRFMVDGQWADDPQATLHEPNGFGSQNCVRQVAVV